MAAATKPLEYVIRYCGGEKSYFKGWTSPARIPQFGAKLNDAQRYSTDDAAREEIDKMPYVAGVMCEIKPVVARKKRK